MAIALDSSEQLSISSLEAIRKRRQLLLAGLAVLVSFAFVRLVLSFGVFTVGGIVAWLIMVAILLQPRFAVYLTLAMVVMFEKSLDDPLMIPGIYFNTSLQGTNGLTGEILIPFEIILLLAVFAWLAHGAMQHRLDFRAGAFGRPMLLLACALAFGVVHGLLS